MHSEDRSKGNFTGGTLRFTINREVIQVYQRSLVGMESLETVLGDSS